MIVSHIVTSFRRFGVKVDECIYINGEPYFSADAIGKFLGFKNPANYVNRVVERNPYIEEYSKVIKIISLKKQSERGLLLDVKLTSIYNPHHNPLSAEKTASNSHTRATYKKRFFDLMGFFLIAQESHTPVAIQCKAMLARLGKMFLLGKLVERTPEEIEIEQHLDNYTRIKKGYGIRTEEIKRYMLKTGCSHATAYRHAAKVKKGESPFDKDWKNCMKPVIDDDLGLRIREIYFQDPNQTMKDIWRAIGEKPSYTTVKKYVNMLKREFKAAKEK